MGYNSVIFLCNDSIGEIKKGPEEWWETTWHHLNEPDCAAGWTSEYGFGNHLNGFRAVWNAHADQTAVIIVGQNMAQVAYQRYGGVGFHEAEGQVKLLREWAAELGYEIRKSPNSKLTKKLDHVEGQLANRTERFHSAQSYRSWKRWLASLRDHLTRLIE